MWQSMHSAAFLQDLAVVMLVAACVTVLFRWFHQPVVLGYIFAGLIIGPHLLPTPLITKSSRRPELKARMGSRDRA